MILGIDTGATFTRVWDGKNPVQKIKTPFEYDEYLACLKEIIASHWPVTCLAIALPAVIEEQKVKVIPNLGKSWLKRHIKTDLIPFFPSLESVLVLQDTYAAAYGIRYYEPKLTLPAMVVTLSTGVGGALISEGYIDPLEIGHIPLNLRDRNTLCICGQVGCVEADISGTAIYKRVGLRAEEIDDQTFWEDYASNLGQFLSVLSVLFKLKQIVLMGGLSNKSDHFLSGTKQYLEKTIRYVPVPEIQVSTLGDSAGVYGACEIAALFASGNEIRLA